MTANQLLTLDEAAERMGVSVDGVLYALAAGCGPSIVTTDCGPKLWESDVDKWSRAVALMRPVSSPHQPRGGGVTHGHLAADAARQADAAASAAVTARDTAAGSASGEGEAS